MSQKNDALMRRNGSSPTASGFCSTATIALALRRGERRQARLVALAAQLDLADALDVPAARRAARERVAQRGFNVEAWMRHAPDGAEARERHLERW